MLKVFRFGSSATSSSLIRAIGASSVSNSNNNININSTVINGGLVHRSFWLTAEMKNAQAVWRAEVFASKETAILQSSLLDAISEFTKPVKVEGGRWRPPLFSKRKVALARKRDVRLGFAEPEEQKPVNMSYHIVRAQRMKGHKHERQAEARQLNIEKNMAKMKELLLAHRKALVAAKKPNIMEATIQKIKP